MCRNITELRGLQPPATAEEITAAARQYVRKVSGLTKVPATAEHAFEDAVREVAEITTRLLAALPPRRQPPADGAAAASSRGPGPHPGSRRCLLTSPGR